MKRITVFGLFLSLTMSFGTLCAKEFPLTKTPPSESVLKDFSRKYPAAENTAWFAYSDEKGNEFALAEFTREGDQKKIYYKNNHYLCLLTVVPSEYCPRKIKTNIEVLHSDFAISGVYLVQSAYNPFYFVQMTKGKKKKVEYMSMSFSATGDEMNMEDYEPLKEIIEELNFNN